MKPVYDGTTYRKACIQDDTERTNIPQAVFEPAIPVCRRPGTTMVVFLIWIVVNGFKLTCVLLDIVCCSIYNTCANLLRWSSKIVLSDVWRSEALKRRTVTWLVNITIRSLDTEHFKWKVYHKIFKPFSYLRVKDTDKFILICCVEYLKENWFCVKYLSVKVVNEIAQRIRGKS